jgi:solute carrier family 25 uncoupling protein 27
MNYQQKYKKLVLIQTSACMAETVTYPIDYIKTSIQVNPNKISFYGNLQQVVRSKNKLQIYDGLKPALLRHCIYTALRINIYETLRDKQTINTISSKFIIGGVSGGIAQLVASPFDLLKIRYITNLKNVKDQRKITLGRTIKEIYTENGIRGLWKGVGPNVSRAMLVNLGELATYDQSKQFIKKQLNLEDNTPLHVMSSICSGFVASLCCTPADVIKSRMMQTNSPYHGIGDCIFKTVSNEGILSLYKGFYPIWFRLAPWQLIFWVSYEKLRLVSGLETF